MDYGRGTIYQRTGDGLWCAAVELTRGLEARRRKTFTGKTREIVEAKLDAYRQANPALGQSIDSQGRKGNTERARAIGRHTDKEWRDHCKAVAWRCEYCGIETHDLFKKVGGGYTTRSARKRVKDHRTPLAAGGSDAIENIACACHRCNGLKGVMDEPTFRAWMAAQ